MGNNYSVSCDPICGFNLKSHDKKEVERMAVEHVASAHPDMNMSMNEVRKMVKTE